jgi:hypothetical protein
MDLEIKNFQGERIRLGGEDSKYLRNAGGTAQICIIL